MQYSSIPRGIATGLLCARIWPIPRRLTRFVTMFSAAAALSLAGSTSIPTTTWAAGARTAFNAASALNLASYCNGQDTLDDTECMGRWRNDAAAKGVDLYAPVGTWRYNGNLNPYNGMNLRCESSSAVFKNHEGARGSFIYTWPATKFQDVSIEN